MGKSYRDLIVWQKSMELVRQIYRLTRAFPRDEIYGLTAQLRRAAVSVPSNIAEGQGRRSNQEFRQFLGLARGSVMEIETQLMIVEDLQYLEHKEVERLLKMCAEIGRMLNGLMDALEEQLATGDRRLATGAGKR